MSEQSVRVEVVLRLAEAIFENEEEARQWMSLPNQALGGNPPLYSAKLNSGLSRFGAF